MGRAPCCDMEGLKKGPWTPEEDEKLLDYIKRNGHGSWRSIPKRAGLLRCGKSCRLRWTNYLRPDIKRGKFSSEEEQTIIQLHGSMGNKWSSIAARLPGRTDNEIKNYWNTHLRKRLLRMGLDPVTHRPMMGFFNFGNMNHFLGGPAAHSYMTAWWRNAMLQQAITREYLRIIATSIIHGQQQGSINAAELLMRSQLQNPIAKPEFNTNSIMSQFWSRNSKSQLGFLLEQFQSQSQIMKDNQHLPLAFGPHGFNTDKASLIPDQKLNGSEACNGLVNGSNLNMLDPPSKSQNITSSLALDISLLWDEDDLTGVSKSKSESLPAIISSTSSPDMFNDADLVSNVASSMVETNTSITANTTTPTTNEAYDFPTNFPWDLSENSERNENIPDTQNCADDRDYWSNMLKFVTECTVNNSRGLLGIRK